MSSTCCSHTLPKGLWWATGTAHCIIHVSHVQSPGVWSPINTLRHFKVTVLLVLQFLIVVHNPVNLSSFTCCVNRKAQSSRDSVVWLSSDHTASLKTVGVKQRYMRHRPWGLVVAAHEMYPSVIRVRSVGWMDWQQTFCKYWSYMFFICYQKLGCVRCLS